MLRPHLHRCRRFGARRLLRGLGAPCRRYGDDSDGLTRWGSAGALSHHAPPLGGGAPAPAGGAASLVRHAERFETLRCDVSTDGVASIVLSRPGKGNAINVRMWDELSAAFDTIDLDSSVRAVVMSGDGGNFSTGMDLAVFEAISSVGAGESCDGRRREALMAVIRRLQHVCSAPERCKVPVIAAVSGHCIGAAIDLITACDLRLAAASARFSVKEVDLAIVADLGTLQRLPRHTTGVEYANTYGHHVPFTALMPAIL